MSAKGFAAMQMFNPALVGELKSAMSVLAARYRQLMQVHEEGAGTLGGKAGISADAKVLWGEATWARKRDERVRLTEAMARLDVEMEEQVERPAFPKATDKAVRSTMRERVANWPDGQSAPNEEEDFEAVSAQFAPGSLSREEFRAVRRDETPKEWRTQGQRGSWGRVKPKSAV
jgi:hypothetical protein